VSRRRQGMATMRASRVGRAASFHLLWIRRQTDGHPLCATRSEKQFSVRHVDAARRGSGRADVRRIYLIDTLFFWMKVFNDSANWRSRAGTSGLSSSRFLLREHILKAEF
jgi:hypothetical protein